MTLGCSHVFFEKARFFRAFLLAFLCFQSLPAHALKLPYMDLGVELKTTKPSYYRYEFVEFYVEARGARLHPHSDSILSVRILRNGKIFPGLPYRPQAQLRWDPNRETWRGRWPVPWNPPLGEYEAVLLRPGSSNQPTEHYAGPGEYNYSFTGKDEVLARSRFEIRGRKAMKLPPGFGVMTLEPGRRRYSQFPGVDGEKPSPTRILDWAKYMHADAFWHAAGLTSIWGSRDPENYPWIKGHLVMMDVLGREAKKRDILYGAYILAFIVGGNRRKADYTFTTGFDKKTDRLRSLRFISLNDERRHRDVVDLLKKLNENELVDQIGLDYMRTDRGGLEFTDQFLSDMDVRVNTALRQGTVQSRQRWLGRILARDEEPELEDLWNWWRAHKVAQVLKAMLEEAEVRKPVWVFSLSWEQGHQHGQDPFMLIDAGLSFNAPMFYHANEDQFPQILRQWKRYLKQGEGTFILGQPVDSKLLVNRAKRPGPEEHYKRQMESLAIADPKKHQLGFFWHDLDRAVNGSGFSTKEWAISAATTFSSLREKQGVQPLSLKILSPKMTPLGVNFKVRVSNLGKRPMKKIKITGLPMPGIAEYSKSKKTIYNLAPGKSRIVSWEAIWGERKLRLGKADMRMIALRAHAPFDDVRHPSFAFRYVGDKDAY